VHATPELESRRDALVERLSAAALGALDLLAVYLGDRLGLYRTLASQGTLTAGELARLAGIDERYAREWLEQQAVTGILEVDGAGRFTLPEGHDEVLTDESSLAFTAPFGRLIAAVARPLDELVEAYRTGAGVPYDAYGEDMVIGQSQFTRPLFERLLGNEWLPAVPEIDARLRDDPPARVADLACGGGRSSLAIARAYPRVRVDGIDLDAASIELARANLAGSGLEDRVAFVHSNAGEVEGRYDLVTIFEALHDMAHPVDVLRTAAAMLADGGSVLVADERVADAFTAPADAAERLTYGFSVTHCLPVGRTEPGSAATGAVMRAGTLRRYATAAGFTRVDVLDIESDVWRFYRLRA
jgi:SAM-dependent methyltransferase